MSASVDWQAQAPVHLKHDQVPAALAREITSPMSRPLSPEPSKLLQRPQDQRETEAKEE